MTDQNPGLNGQPSTPGVGETIESPAAPNLVATQPVGVMPVAGRSTSGTGRSRVRWLAALVVTALVVAVAAGATLMLTGAAGDPDVLAWTPKDSVAYAELRLDLPGSQEAELAKAMQAFPGFDDQAAFPTKLSEALDQLVKRATDGDISYQADIEPWFGGQVSISVGPLPATADASSARGLLLAGVTDATTASAWADKLLATTGATTSTETYNGVTITTVTPPAADAKLAGGMQGAYAVFGSVIGVGDVASIKAAIDTKGSAGLATNDQFKTAAASVSGDRLGFAYLDTAALASGAMAIGGDAVASAVPDLPATLTDLAPPWAAAALRASGGSFVVETRMPHLDKLGPAATAESKLPSVLPATTLALVEGHDLGGSLERLKTMLAADPSLADGVDQVDSALALLGGFPAIVDWMDEAGIAITRDGDGLAGGLVVTPKDRAAADRLLTQLRSFLTLAGGSSGIKVTDETYGDTTITIVDLGDLGALAGSGLGGDVSAMPANLSIAYAVTDQVVVVGSGTSFVKAVLDARTGDSLATSNRFVQAVGQVDKSHGSLLWLDVAGIRTFVEAQMPAADRGDYDTNAKPYLDAFDAIIGTLTPGDTVDRGTLVIRVTGQ